MEEKKRTVSDGHRIQLERNKRKWDFWSSQEWFWELNARDTIAHRREAISSLGLERGDAVLDVGCGMGTNFELLREAVGPEGDVLGVDCSPGMVAKAEERIDSNGWDNVETLCADVTRPCLDSERFDGALATTAVSAVPDVQSAVENAYDVLKPGARFALHEIRLVPSGFGRVLNPLILRFYRLFGNWNAEEDVLERLRATFDGVTFERTFALGTNYVVVASKVERQT